MDAVGSRFSRTTSSAQESFSCNCCLFGNPSPRLVELFQVSLNSILRLFKELLHTLIYIINITWSDTPILVFSNSSSFSAVFCCSGWKMST